MTAKELAKKIIKGGDYPKQVEENALFARELVSLLNADGFKKSKSYDYCSKASYEATIAKGKRRINVVAANFMGQFVNISETKI